MATPKRGLASSAAIVLQAATFCVAGVSYWSSIQKQGTIDAVALEHRLSGIEGDIRDIRGRLDRLSGYLREHRQ